MSFLTAAEIAALLAAPDLNRWEGRRDRAMMLLAVQTGLRVSELIGLNCADVTLGDGANVRCEGKGRKHRAVPLTGPVINIVRGWLAERAGRPGDPLFCTRTGRRLSRDAVALRVRTHTATAVQRCPTLAGKRVPPRAAAQLRHDPAAGRGRHLRHRALARSRRRPVDRPLPPRRHHDQGTSPRPDQPATAKPGRYRPADKTLAFLESL